MAMTNEEDFDAFVRARWTTTARLAYALTLDHQKAEDLAQESFTKLWFHWRKARGESPEGYLRKIVTTTFLSGARRRWSAERPADTLPETAIGPETGRVDDRLALHAAMSRLSPRQRAAVYQPAGLEDHLDRPGRRRWAPGQAADQPAEAADLRGLHPCYSRRGEVVPNAFAADGCKDGCQTCRFCPVDQSRSSDRWACGLRIRRERPAKRSPRECARTRNRGEAERLVETARCRVAVVSA